MATEEGKKIGEIIHFYSKIKVGIVQLSSGLEVGDNIRIIGGEVDFDQSVQSMEIDKKKVSKAKKGDSIGLEFSQKVRKGYKVYKI